MFESIKRKMMSPEWLAQHPELNQEEPKQEEPVVVSKPTTNVKPVQKTVTVSFDDDTTVPETTDPSSPEANQEMIQKIYGLLEKLNKEGIDFFEVWDATEQMDGGVTASNVKNAFIALRAASGNKLTKEFVLETARYYKEKIQEALNADVKTKKTEKSQLQQKLSSEKDSLQTSVDELTKQIELLTQQKEQAEQSLLKIDSKYKPLIQKIDERITSGTSAVQSVNSEIDSFVDIFDKVIK